MADFFANIAGMHRGRWRTCWRRLIHVRSDSGPGGRRRAGLHLDGAEDLRPDSGPPGPDARRRQVRLAADAGRRHQADHQRRPDAAGRRSAAVSRWRPTSVSPPASPPSWPCPSPTAGWRQKINVAVFFILAVLGLEVFGVILAGYASGSKWSLFGAMREAAQVVSYEVPLGMCVVVPVLLCGTMNLVDDRQHAGRLVHQLADLPRSVHVLSSSGSISPAPWPA